MTTPDKATPDQLIEVIHGLEGMLDDLGYPPKHILETIEEDETDLETLSDHAAYLMDLLEGHIHSRI